MFTILYVIFYCSVDINSSEILNQTFGIGSSSDKAIAIKNAGVVPR